MTEFYYHDRVRPDWTDYNGHMNDAAYAAVFSFAVDELIEQLGLDETNRKHDHYTFFTLETHVCYLKEAYEQQKLNVSVQLLDHDAKRLHLIFFMKNNVGDLLATSEQMLMGIATDKGWPGPFPAPVQDKVTALWKKYEKTERPPQAGRVIGIKR